MASVKGLQKVIIEKGFNLILINTSDMDVGEKGQMICSG